jgi:hypothetical protein
MIRIIEKFIFKLIMKKIKLAIVNYFNITIGSL